MVLKVCGYYWINVSPIKEIIIRYLCTFKLTLKRSLWRRQWLLLFPPHLFISYSLNALGTEGNGPTAAGGGGGLPWVLLPRGYRDMGARRPPVE